MLDDIPAQVGRYRVQQVLGRGAMGVVLRAYDPEIGRPVAIKLIRADLLDGVDRDAYLARFRREAQAAGRCMHPNIVAVYDFALHEGNPFIAMEYLEGGSLAQAAQHGARFSRDEAVSITLQVLQALDCAHGLGVIHRDIKPANILVAAGRVKVMDFGISRLPDSNLTHASVLGTPSYMSPEQCRGAEVDHRSDIFSTGVVLYELLTGARPFPGRTFTEIVTRLLHDDAPDLRAVAPDAPPGLSHVVRQALAKCPAERFASAAAMMEALRRFGDGDAAGDGTVVLARAAVPRSGQPSADLLLDPEVLSTLQRRLAHYLGPIASRLVSSAARTAVTLDALCDTLARNIASAAEREEFRTAALRDYGLAGLRTGLTSAGLATAGLARSLTARQAAGPQPPVVSPEVILRAQTELTRHIGPIARVLARRALERSASPSEFWTQLAQHIERPSDRAAFLAHQTR